VEKPPRGQQIQTGIAGEHFVAAELSRRGWVVALPMKNTPDFDMLAYREIGATIRVQVKTRREHKKTKAWRITSPFPDGPSDFLVAVSLEEFGQPRYWILPCAEANAIVTSEQLRRNKLDQYEDAWDLLAA
jgi:hypothetical protein